MKREELPDTFYCTGMLLPPLLIVTTPACALQDFRSRKTALLLSRFENKFCYPRTKIKGVGASLFSKV